MEDRINTASKSHAAHIAPARRPRGWEQRMRGDFVHPSRTQSELPQPHLKSVSSMDEPAALQRPSKIGCPPCHRGMLICLLLIVGFSVPLVFSASTAFALVKHSSTYFLWRQIAFVLIGFAVMISVSRLSSNKIKFLGWVLYGLTILGLIATKWSPLGVADASHVVRWMKLGPIQLQVSELGKIALLLVLANYWSKAAKTTHKNSIEGFSPWLFSGFVLTAPIVLLVVIQPHLSAALVLFSLLWIVAFFAGVPGRQYIKIIGGIALFLGIIIGLSAIMNVTFLKGYQKDRIAHFLSSDKNDQAGNYQTAQGLRAIERGGWIGVGPGNSLYKQGHLPAPHTDFILAITGEEWGVAGMLVLLSLYGLLIFFCLQVGHTAGNAFEMLVATGMGMLLFVQVFANMGVVLGILPVTGMPLPFISYGGSGLICLLLGMGIVLGISRHQD